MNIDLSKIVDTYFVPSDNETQGFIDRFDVAAQDWGWMRDQGYGPSVNTSKEAYEHAKAALEQHILKLIKEK